MNQKWLRRLVMQVYMYRHRKKIPFYMHFPHPNLITGKFFVQNLAFTRIILDQHECLKKKLLKSIRRKSFGFLQEFLYVIINKRDFFTKIIDIYNFILEI